MDVLVLISNCPQLNNPCNAYNPTPVRLLIWDRRVAATTHADTMFEKVLIANRGEIACRIMRTLRTHGRRLASPSTPTPTATRRTSREADEAVRLGPAPARAELPRRRRDPRRRARDRRRGDPSGLRLPERERRVRRGVRSGRASPSSGRRRRRCATSASSTPRASWRERCGVPLLPGTRAARRRRRGAARGAARIGYPVMLKSTAGGGGIGMRRCDDAARARGAFDAVRAPRRGAISSDAGALPREASSRARATSRCRSSATARAAWSRSASATARCSGATRRSSRRRRRRDLPPASRDALAARRRCARRSAVALPLGRHGRVRLRRRRAATFYFLEVNTRLQVEHGVTEEVTGVDLVEWMVRLAAGELPPLDALRAAAARRCDRGAALRRGSAARISSPAPALLTEVTFPADGVRVETWVERGTEVTPFYDPMLAKIIARGADARRGASAAARRRSTRRRIDGIETNLDYLRAGHRHAGVSRRRRAHALPRRTSPIAPRPSRCSSGGTQTTVQDYPGRLGYWDVGVPPSGPMDDAGVSPRQPAGRQPRRRRRRSRCTLAGPTLRFHTRRVIALDRRRHGADARRRAGRRAGSAFAVAAGSVLRLGAVRGAGRRAYLAVRGGFDVPAYLGSRATFTLGPLRRPRRARAAHRRRAAHRAAGDAPTPAPTRRSSRDLAAAAAQRRWEIGVLYGPHGAPDFFTPDDIDVFFATDVEGALQLRPHRRAPDRPEAGVGAPRRRRGRAASLEHPRQRLRHRRRRLHRRHADHPRARRPEPGRLRLPGDHRRAPSCGRSASSRPGDTRALPRRHARRGARAAAAQDSAIASLATPAERATARDVPLPISADDRGRSCARSPADGDAPARRDHPPGRRRVPAGRVRADGARPRRCASASTRCMQALRAERAARASST